MRIIFVCGYCNKQHQTHANALDCENSCLKNWKGFSDSKKPEEKPKQEPKADQK